MPSLIRILGRPEVQSDGVPRQIGSKSIALLAYLTLENRRHPRSTLANLIWPRSDLRRGLRSLSQALYAVRNACGRDVIRSDSNYLYGTTIDSDLARFRWHITNRNWVEAAALVEGPLCDDLHIESTQYDQWLSTSRWEVLDEIRQLLDRLAVAFEWEHLHRLTSLFPQYADGDQELSRLSSLAHAGLAERARRPKSDALTGDIGPATFVGRTDEIGRLVEAQRRSVDSEENVVAIVSGAAGIGKTALCNRFLRLHALRGGRSCSARGYSAEENLPLGVVQQLLADEHLARSVISLEERWRRVLSDVFPNSATGSGGGQERASPALVQVFEAIRRGLLKTAEGSPMVVFVDDVQWADPTSRMFLHHISRRPFDPGLLVLMAGSNSFTQAFTTDYPVAEVIELKGLDATSIGEWICRADTDHPSDLDQDGLRRRTGGNPTFIRALLASVPGDNEVEIMSDSAIGFLRHRLRDLSEDAQLLLGALSVLGDSAALEMAVAVAGIGEDAIGRVVLELTKSGFIDSNAERLRSMYSLAGEAILADSPPVIKRLLYARAARELRIAGSSPPAVLAVHLDIAGESEEAFDQAMEAASASLRLSAHREAAYFYKLALSHASSVEAKASVRLRIADLYLRMGKTGDALDVVEWERWNEVGESTRVWVDVIKLVVALTNLSDVPESMKLAWEVVQRAETLGEPEAAATVLVKVVSAADTMGLLAEARRAAHQIVRLLPHLPNDERTVRYRGQAAGVLGLTESVPKARALLLDIFESAQAPEAKIQYSASSAIINFTAGALREAEQDYLAAISLSERYGVPTLLFRLLNNLSVCYMEMGRFEEAGDCLQTALQFGTDGLVSTGEVLIAYENLSLVAYGEGDFEGCLEMLDRAAKTNRSVQSKRSMASQLGLRGLANLNLGHLARAFECERDLAVLIEPGGLYLPDMSYVEVFVARMHMLRGEEDVAIRRLSGAVEAYRERDIFCRGRLQIELFRIQSRSAPERTLQSARELEADLLRIDARSLLRDIRAVIAEIP